MLKSIEEILHEDTISQSSTPEAETVAAFLLKAAILLAEEATPAESAPSSPDIKQEINVPGGILPVDKEGNTQQIHVLTRNKAGVGVLRSPSGEERPLTESDIKLFKQYFIDLGNLLNVIKPASTK